VYVCKLTVNATCCASLCVMTFLIRSVARFICDICPSCQ